MIEILRRRLRLTMLRGPVVWYRHRSVGTNDVFLASYPRSGNTWMRFLLWELLSGQTADFGTAEKLIPYIGHQRGSVPALLPNGGRAFKTHEKPRLEYQRSVFIVRDPRDVAVSNYEYDRANFRYVDRGLDHYLDKYVSGGINPFGSWETHTHSWLSSPLLKKGALLVIRYEDLRSNPEKILARVASFLELRVDSSAIRNAVLNNSLSKMREKEDLRIARAGFRGNPELVESGRFVRQGSVGGWRARLTERQSDLIEDHAGTLMQALGYTKGRIHLSMAKEGDKTASNDRPPLAGFAFSLE
jgi:hypothetical protein